MLTLKPNPGHRGDPTFIPELFRQLGIPLTIMPGAMDWGMGDFGYIQGVFWHHTGARNTSAAYIARNPGLSNGLSSQFHIGPKGQHTLCGIGIAWHAGRGYGNGWPANDANRVAIGYEIQANGTDPWDQGQLEQVRRSTAAILWYLGHDATIDHMISHEEYSRAAQGKWDPGAGTGVSGQSMLMAPERARVQAYINNIRKFGALDAPTIKKEEDDPMLFERITTFIKGFIGPIGSDIKDVRQQLTGGRDAGQYPGWPQLGKHAAGQNLTLVDAVAATRTDLMRVEKKLDQLISQGGK